LIRGNQAPGVAALSAGEVTTRITSGFRPTKSAAADRSDLDLTSKYQANIRLTGSVPMADEEFATVQRGALVNGIATVIVVLAILWLALKSARIMSAVFINLFVGLAITAALGLMMVGALNMISASASVRSCSGLRGGLPDGAAGRSVWTDRATACHSG